VLGRSDQSSVCSAGSCAQSKLVKVLNLWQKNGVFKSDMIQPLLDKATGSGAAATSSYPSAKDSGK